MPAAGMATSLPSVQRSMLQPSGSSTVPHAVAALTALHRPVTSLQMIQGTTTTQHCQQATPLMHPVRSQLSPYGGLERPSPPTLVPQSTMSQGTASRAVLPPTLSWPAAWQQPAQQQSMDWSVPGTMTGSGHVQPRMQWTPCPAVVGSPAGLAVHSTCHSPAIGHSEQHPFFRQPVPVPSLPDLVSDSEREFAELKMAMDELLNTHTELSEHYKYRVLLEHLKLEEAQLIAQACRHYTQPYTEAMLALQYQYGQPHQLAQSEIAIILNSPALAVGDSRAFQSFALKVELLVGMLMSLEGPQGAELNCSGHVDRLLSKLPQYLRDGFVEHLLASGKLHTTMLNPYNLHDLAMWLRAKAAAQRLSDKMARRYDVGGERPPQLTGDALQGRGSAANSSSSAAVVQPRVESRVDGTGGHGAPSGRGQKEKRADKRLCLYCNDHNHYLSHCPRIDACRPEQLVAWIRDGRRCWKCGRTSHRCGECTLRKPCDDCGEVHLRVLHRIAALGPTILHVTSGSKVRLATSASVGRVYLKVVPVRIASGGRTLDTYAILDDGAERSMLLPEAAELLQLQGRHESVALRTIRQGVSVLEGAVVDFDVAPVSKPDERYTIRGAFTSPQLALAEKSYPIESLQTRYRHLRGLPLASFENVAPLLLIGSDHNHLLAATGPVRLGPAGSPAAVPTVLGWALQGPDGLLLGQQSSVQCLHVAATREVDDIFRQVERLWQLDVLPFRDEKVVTRSRQDTEAMDLLERKTERVEVDGVMRYATPLLRKSDATPLKIAWQAVMPTLRSVEKRLHVAPDRAAVHNAEIQRLVEKGYVTKLSQEVADLSDESWFIPHHLVQHNGKDRLVFNCSFSCQGRSLNDQLLPGPNLSSSLVGVLLRFRQHSVAISGDIRAMFHQIRLLPEHRSLLRFIWRDLQVTRDPDIYEWQVLPFGTTCSPCCATFALQKHVKDAHLGNGDVLHSVEQCFYVDNCLQSLPTIEEGRHLIDKMRPLLTAGGFEIRQWASNRPDVVEHLPSAARSENVELWFAQGPSDLQEPALGLRWQCLADTLGYRHRPLEVGPLTMRNIYRILASQYDPLGYIVPFTTRAKVLVQKFWARDRGWDDPNLPSDLLAMWRAWEAELPGLSEVTLPRCYAAAGTDTESAEFHLHVFCDASEQAYGSVAYLLVKHGGASQTSFVMARSRVAPKKQLSMPRLELCAALTGAQLAVMLERELTLSLTRTTLWSDSTTVLAWLRSESCRFKVFVGTRVAEIQELTESHVWRYVDTSNNPADDLTRGKTLLELSKPCRWNSGPAFLLLPPDQWPSSVGLEVRDDPVEVRQSVFCGISSVQVDQSLPEPEQFGSWSALVTATCGFLDGAALDRGTESESGLGAAEVALLRRCQMESFPEDVEDLGSGRPVRPSSRLAGLAPEMDVGSGLIRVGGRLRRVEGVDPMDVHPIVLEPSHVVTRLLIADFDNRLLHPGPDRVFAELRRRYWILRGRQAVRSHQAKCVDCRRWRATPVVPVMADLPTARLRLHKPPFFSTGVDCFGPFQVKFGRRVEKRWGVLFKCLTTRAVHLELLTGLDVDAFLMSLRRFIARRGRPFEILADNGTNFKGAERELREAFNALEPSLKEQLAEFQIRFRFNPPSAPHFGGVWEREVRSVKAGLRVVIGTQSVTEEVLHTVLVEVEGILNSKPLGYVSSDVADPDPVTPNMLLMGRRDASLPQAEYVPDGLSKRRWRHCQVVLDQFWRCFVQRYLSDLQSRQKWRRGNEDLKVGTVVMVVDRNLPRAYWPIGRIASVVRSDDGHVRSAEVKIGDRSYQRPVAKLVPLPELPD